MSIVIIAPPVPAAKWKWAFATLAPKIKVYVGHDIPDPEAIQYAMLWRFPKGVLKKFKNLKLIYSMGAGVDGVLADPSIPKEIPICRVVDPQMAFSMSNYILMAVLQHHRQWDAYAQAQRQKHWAQHEVDELDLSIGILGLGHLGMDAALKLHHLGFAVSGYSTSPKKTPFTSYYGEALPAFLGSLNVLICVLPLTPKTKGFLNQSLFDQLKQPTFLINVSRGNVQLEQDIITALDKGQLNGAFLDVFEQEPLPPESELWQHPKIKLTPHIASLTRESASVHQVLENIKRLTTKTPLLHQVDREKMY
ncbi:MAG: 2-hydroxyacid dehydrogenase [Flavobacteriaceae bacterium]